MADSTQSASASPPDERAHDGSDASSPQARADGSDAPAAEPSPAPPAARSAQATGTQTVDPLIGRIINERFFIHSVIARGGMGKVYKAEQRPLGRICAVKVLDPKYTGDTDPEFHKRFFLEASIASKLKHPNTVTIFDYGRTDDDVYFMAMEYLEGRTLHRLLRDVGPLPAPRALHIARQICRSLREAHGLNVIHRDLKPANVFLIKHDDEDDFVKVLDFGLVKNVDENSAESITQTGLFMGSPKYMAPEQIRGERVGPSTDVYALGVVLFEMLTGRVPFDRGNSMNTLMAHVNDPVPSMRDAAPSAGVPGPVEDVVRRCLAKGPDERFNTMDELLLALKRVSELVGAGPGTAEFASGMLDLSRLSSSELPARPLTGDHAAFEPRISQTGLATPSRPPSLRPSSPPESSTQTPMLVAHGAELSSSKAPSSRGVLFVAGLVVALTGGGAFLWARAHASLSRDPSALTQGLASAPAVPAPSSSSSGPVPTGLAPATTAAPSASPRERSLRVALDSTPPGAEVFEGTRSLGRTPLRLEWMGDQADPARSHTFTFRLANYRDSEVTLQGSSLEYAATLVARPARVNPRPSARGPYRDLPDDWR